jgi:flavodoxin
VNVVVLYESRTGNTQRAAEYVAGACRQAGVDQLAVNPVSAPDLTALAAADVVFVGTWTDGLILFGHRPGGMRNIRALPVLDRKNVAVFCTYAVNPGSTAHQLGRALERLKGATIVGEAQFKRTDIDKLVGRYVDDVLATVVGAPS